MPIQLPRHGPSENEARIEIIPLIDIMFFLLASFMLVSLSMVRVKGVKVDLPGASTAESDIRRDPLTVTVDKRGALFLERDMVVPSELGPRLRALRSENPAMQLLIRGDVDARHGVILQVLDAARGAGISGITFETHPMESPKSGP